MMISDANLKVDLTQKNIEKRIHFLKNLMKAPKLSRLNFQENFVCKGWDTCSAQFDSGSDEREYDIKSSPTRHQKASCKRLPVQDSCRKKKSMLVEISNIESVFKEKEIKSPKWNPPQNFYDFKKNLFAREKFSKNHNCKKIIPGSFNLEQIKTSFQFQKQQIKESLNSSDHTIDINSDYNSNKISSNKNERSNNCNEARKLSKTFINNSFKEICQKKTISSHMTKNNFIPRNVKSSKMLCTSISCVFLEGENKANINSLDKKYINETIDLKKLMNSSHFDHIGSVKGVCSSIRVPHVEENKLFINQHSSELNVDSDYLIKDDSSPEQITSAKSVCAPLSVTSPSKFKEQNEAFQSKCMNENVTSNTLANNTVSCQANSSEGICTFTFVPSADENISNYSSHSNFCPSNLLDDSSTVQGKLQKTVCTPQSSEITQHFKKNESLQSEHSKFSTEAKSLVFENKDFMKSVHMPFKEKFSSANKGSKWVQSLNWTDMSVAKNTSNFSDQVSKKTLKNIVQGGFAEQMLKLRRRERSDKVIFNHKMDELKKKAAASSVTFTLASFLCIGQIIVTKCYASEKDNDNFQAIAPDIKSEDFYLKFSVSIFDKLEDSFCSNTLQDMGYKPFIILFKKDTFSKLHLKISDMFVLYPPWQMLCGKSLSYPVLLCTYYVAPLNESLNIPNISAVVHSQPVIYYSLQSEEVEWEEFEFSNSAANNFWDLYGRCISLSARVQRIWKNFILNDTVQDMLKTDFSGFSLLLQNKEGIFLELQINSVDLPPSYREFLFSAEGLCFKFSDIVMSYRYNLSKCQDLSRIIEFIQMEAKCDTASLSSQIYCCQFIPSSLSRLPAKISDENFPRYCDIEVKPLSIILKHCVIGTRISCVGKVFFQHKKDFYISDESLLGVQLQKYYKVKLSRVQKQTTIGATVLIKEAVISEGCLIVDKFSCCEVISKANTSKVILTCEPRLKKIGFMTCEHILSPLSLSSKLKELVFVKGTITEVDEDSAISWLECSQCLKENLLEDSNFTVYCEDCSCIVLKPVLKVKMEVTVQPADLACTKIKIQLQSATIKRILNIREGNYNPQCNISDVVKKETGDLPCFVRNIEMMDGQKVFHLTEMVSCL